MQKRANLSLIFVIIAIALQIAGRAIAYLLASGAPVRYFLSNLLYLIPCVIVAFIVPVFVIIGRKAPKAKKPLSVIAFIFLGIQLIFVMLSLVFEIFDRGLGLRVGGWNLLNIINGSGLFADMIAIMRGWGWAFVLAMAIYVISDVFYILKNLLGAIDLCRRPRAAAPGYYAPQYPQYAAPAPQQPAPAPQQYAAPAPQPAPAAQPAPAPKFCSECGAPVEGAGVFCGKCGAKIAR